VVAVVESCPVAAAITAAAGLPADANGFPQSIQNRELASLAAPQKLHAVMQTPEAGKMAWAANIRLRHGRWQ
jgi:hypothetical protein